MSKTVTCNGESHETSSETLTQFLEELSLAGKRIAVELNKEIVSREKYQNTQISDGDSIEIVHFVGGG